MALILNSMCHEIGTSSVYMFLEVCEQRIKPIVCCFLSSRIGAQVGCTIGCAPVFHCTFLWTIIFQLYMYNTLYVLYADFAIVHLLNALYVSLDSDFLIVQCCGPFGNHVLECSDWVHFGHVRFFVPCIQPVSRLIGFACTFLGNME